MKITKKELKETIKCAPNNADLNYLDVSFNRKLAMLFI